MLCSIFPLIGWNKYVAEVYTVSIMIHSIVIMWETAKLMFNYFSYPRKAYLMGCTFDSFSSSWNDRSYVLTMMVVAWLIPTAINVFCYVAIVNRVHHSDFKLIGLHRMGCYSQSMVVTKRVRYFLEMLVLTTINLFERYLL